jgi:hypothetical protein
MVALRRWTILLHRYLGIVLSLLFLTWFVSGIAMIYARGMPSLTPEGRRARMPALDLSQFRLSPSEAAEQAGVADSPGQVSLVTALNRPAYRFSAQGGVVVFADTGDLLEAVTEAQSLEAAARFTGASLSSLRHVGLLNEADQWTLTERRQLPLHKITVDDTPRTELYVSERSGEVVLTTTRGSRALSWVAAIPHWLYFAALRGNDDLWRQVVLWTSGLGIVSALLGLVLAITQYRVLYRGILRWHYVTGVIFGVFTLTWVFSGLMTMEPWFWASSDEVGPQIRTALGGGRIDLSDFSTEHLAREDPSLLRDVRQIDLRRLQGRPFYLLRGVEPQPVLVDAETLQVRSDPVSADVLLGRIRQSAPDLAVASADELREYDAYYYDRDGEAPLPVFRFKLADPENTWLYIDQQRGELLAQFSRRQRLQRWLYQGLHSLDFPFLYNRRPLWDIVVIALCTGGAALSAIGVLLSIRRVRRSVTLGKAA